MKLPGFIVLLCFFSGSLFAQSPKGQSFQDIQQEMLEMQRRLMQQFQEFSPGGQSFTFPQGGWDTTFSFRLDTMINGQRFGSSFFFSPFGQDTTFMRGFGDFDSFFNGMQPFGQMFQWSFPPRGAFPENEENSALEENGDGLLPEERLRKEEGKGTQPSGKEKPQPAKKPKTKTFQI